MSSSLKIRRTGASDYGQVTKVLIAGNPGAGKTLLSSTWPKPFYASAEGGLMSIADRDIPYTDIHSISDLLKLKMTLDQPSSYIEDLFGFEIKTVVIDTIDEIQRILIRERLEETKRDALALQDWGYVSEQMQSIVRGFRRLNLHVIFTCHLKEVTDSETGRVSYKPQMQGGFTDQIAANVDLALLLRTATKTEIIDNKPEKITRRILQTYPDLSYEWVKDRSGKLPKEFEVDFNTDYQRISEAIFGGVELDEAVETEIEVELPKLESPRTAANAAVVPRRGRPPVRAVVTPATPPSAPAAVVEPVVAPVAAPVAEPVEVPPAPAPEVVAEAPTEAPAPAEVNGIIVKNPEKYMPIKGAKLKNLGHGTDIYCLNCGDEVETVRQSELSMVRFRTILCKPCFTEKKR